MQLQQIAGLRLKCHQLVGGRKRQPEELVARMGAVQAQDFGMAKWGTGIRIPGCTETAVEEAFNRGDILRTHVLRPTWHFVTPENIRWMLALSANHIKTSSRSRDRDLGITEPLYCRTSHLICKSLEGNRQLTRNALGKELKKAGIPIDTARLVHFLMRAEADALICSGAMDGKAHTYALLDERVPSARMPAKEEALATLAGIYFAGHSPATLQDFVWWSGLSSAEARIGMEAVRAELVAEKTDDGQTYYRIPDTSTDDLPTAEPSAHLLPAFDEYMIAYRDRRAVLSQENHSKAISSNGVFRSVVLVNGIAVGLWKKSNGKQRVQYDFFTPPDAAAEQLILQAADVWLSFTGQTQPVA
jgi:hypothetical protein